jgi:hypothetical protein
VSREIEFTVLVRFVGSNTQPPDIPNPLPRNQCHRKYAKHDGAHRFTPKLLVYHIDNRFDLAAGFP